MPTTTSSKQPIAITLVTTELRRGGAENNLVNLAIGLSREKFRPTVVSLMASPLEAQSELVTKLTSHEVHVEFLNLRSGLNLPSTILKLRSLFSRSRPQIVQSFLFHANVICALARKFTVVPHHVAGIRVADPRKSRQRLERWMCRKTDRFACVSESVKTFSAEVAGLPREKLLTIPNGIDLDPIDRVHSISLAKFGIAGDRRVIAVVGRLHEQKGLAEFLRQVSPLFERLPNHDLLIVGDGPLRAELQSFVAGQSWRERVHFLGWQPDPLPIIAACDALVLPSLWEGMPNVVMEAMALKKPVAAFLVEGVAELLGAQQANQTCLPGDYSGLFDILSQVVTQESLAASIGAANRRRIEMEFSLANMLSSYEQLYMGLLTAND